MNPFDGIVGIVKVYSWSFLNLFGRDLEWTNRVKPRSVGSSANVNPMDDTILVTATATLTLESPVGCDGRRHTFKLMVAAATMTISSSANIDGAGTAATSTQYGVIRVQSTGATWVTI